MADTADAIARRHARILDLARGTGTVAVETLATELGVTPQTIRRDLNLLARRSMLSRVHGGAVTTSGVDNLDRDARRHVAADAKAAIGAAAAALIPNGASLFINIGTTTEAVAQALVDHRDLLVVTNNLNVVDILGPRPGIEVIAAGGRVRASDRAVVGALAMDFIRGFRTDYALIGTSAIDRDGTLLDFDVDEVRVSQTIIASARTVVLVADRTKIGRAAPVRIADMGAIHHFITNELEPDLATAWTASGVSIRQTGQASMDRPKAFS